MAYPKQKEIALPLLEVINSLGGEASPKSIYPKVAEYFPQLTQEEQNRSMESAPSSKKWWNMVQWVRQKLVERGEIDGSIRGVWKITDKGKKRIDSKTKSLKKKINYSKPESTPEYEITLQDLVDDNQEQVKKRILEELKNLSPGAFENFCKSLLQTLGYINVTVTQRYGDGGIDGYGDFRQGVVQIKSAFQSKRWKETVIGRPEIDRFRGAIQGEFDHGVFLSTSKFSRDAVDASIKKGAITILLLDGDTIAHLMINSNIGIRKREVSIIDIDTDFFDFED